MVSTKGRYALRVMLDLAQQHSDTYIPLEEIAKRQDLSKKYLESILKTLVQHKLLKGLRGKGGGYQLTRSPEEYTVGEILTATESSLSIVSCLMETDPPCPKQKDCLTFPMWQKCDEMLHDYFFGITLKDLMPTMQ